MVNKFILLILFLLLPFLIARAQWVRSAQTVALSSANAIVADNTGAVYTGGIMTCVTIFGIDSLLNSSCVQADSITPAVPQLDAFLSKHDQNGNLLWVKQYKGSSRNKLFINDIDLDDAGNCYLTGSYTGNLNTGSTLLSNPDTTTEFFIMRVRPDGVTDWTVSYATNNKSETSAKKITVTPSSVFITGYVHGKFQIGAYADSVGNNESFVSAFDLLGNSRWTKNFKEINVKSTSAGNAIEAEGDSLWVFSSFTDSVKVENDTIRSAISLAAPAGVISIYDAAGNLLYKALTTTPYIEGIKFSKANASLYFTGRAEDVMSIDNNAIFATAGTRAFVSSHNPDLTVKWVVPLTAPSASSLTGNDIDVNANGSILAGGTFSAGTLAGPTTSATGNGGQNGFMIKIDISGNDLWLQTFGGAKDDAVLSLSSVDDDHIYASGYFSQYMRVAGEKIFNGSGTSFNGFMARIDVCPQLVADMLSPDTTRMCASDSALFNVSANAAYTYQWYTNGTLLPGATNASFYAHTAGEYQAKISGVGCTKFTPPAELFLRPLPDHTISTFDPLENCAGDSVKLTGPPLKLSGKRATNKFFWMDGAVPFPVLDTIKTITIKADGDYYLKITDTLGCFVLSDTFKIRFHPYPLNVISPIAKRYVVCSGDSIALQGDTSQPALRYQWQKDDFPLSNDTLSSYYAKASGTYKVLVSNATGCETLSLADTVVLQQSPLVDLKSDIATGQICQGKSAQLITPLIIGQTYQWIYNSVDVPGATANNLTINTAGQYTVRVKSGFCTRTSGFYNLVVNPLPTAAIVNNTAMTLCDGDPYSLHAQQNSFYSYQWLRNNQTVNGATLPDLAIAQTGNYSVQTTNQFNCQVLSPTTSVLVNLKPPASATAQGPTTFCTGGSVVLLANAGTGLSYQWMRDGNIISGENLLTMEASTSGQYAVQVTNANNCKQRSSSLSVNSVSIPVATLVSATGSTSICERDSLLLTGGSDASYTYSWMRNGQPLPQFISQQAYAKIPGAYQVVASVGVCRDTSATLNLATRPNPLPLITRNGEFLSIALFGDIQWYRNDVAIPGETLQATHVKADGRYSVRVLNSAGCTALSDYTPMCLPVPEVKRKNDILTVSVDNGIYRWNYKEIPITGATQQQIKAQQSGSYSAVVTDTNGCTMETFPVTVCIPYPTITQDSFSGILKAFPHPASSYQWYYNDSLIVDGTTQVNIPGSDGSYTVMVTDLEGCTSVSEPFIIITITGIDPDLSNTISVFPNPVQRQLTIKRPVANESITIIVLDEAGKEIQRQETTESEYVLDFFGRSAGIYSIIVRQKNGLSEWKVVKP